MSDIHRSGGTILGSSRGGGERTKEIVDRMEELGLNILFAVGGDGTQKGALRIAEEIARRGKKMAVVGIPRRSTTTCLSSSARSDSKLRWRKPSWR